MNTWLDQGAPAWAKDAVATTRGWVSAKTGELLVSKTRIAQDLVDAYNRKGSKKVSQEPKLQPTEAPTAAPTEAVTEAPTDAPVESEQEQTGTPAVQQRTARTKTRSTAAK